MIPNPNTKIVRSEVRFGIGSMQMHEKAALLEDLFKIKVEVYIIVMDCAREVA